ncbi:MAG TPA: homoserine kinase [Nocardioidaceae bacterium]|nr:homoserine kinase [Nocardioidaceae bacterium]
MTDFVTHPVTVSVPATSANLGPGFDALGLALEHRDVVTAQVMEGSGVEISVQGRGAGVVPLDERHLVHRSLRAGLELMGVEVPALRLRCRNVIPHARGLGSSSAAIVAGICLARELVVDGSALDDQAVLGLAADLEGHGDNVAPAFLGGFAVAYSDAGRCRAVPLPVHADVQVVVLVPGEGVETSVARALLPTSVPHGDAAFSAGRAALLVAALGLRPELLFAATEDRLHQPYRESAMPESLSLVRRLRSDGLAAVVSGAGPSVLVFADEGSRAAVAAHAPRGWEFLTVPIDRSGARVLPAHEALPG